MDVIGWSETNLEWNDYRVQQDLYKQLKRHLPGSSWRTATSGIPLDRLYKLGGNLMIINKSVRSRTREFGKDRMGRWVWTMIYGKHHNVLVVQLYVPGSETGIYSTYAQQYLQIKREMSKEHPNVIQQYFTDLNLFLDNYKLSQKIIMGDFNRNTEEEEIQELIQRYELCDAFKYAHPTQEPFNTTSKEAVRSTTSW